MSSCTSTVPSAFCWKWAMPTAWLPLIGWSMAIAIGPGCAERHVASERITRSASETSAIFFMRRTISLRPLRHTPGQRAEPAAGRVLVVLRRALLYGVGERRVRRHERSELADLHAVLARDDDLLDERRRL